MTRPRHGSRGPMSQKWKNQRECVRYGGVWHDGRCLNQDQQRSGRRAVSESATHNPTQCQTAVPELVDVAAEAWEAAERRKNASRRGTAALSPLWSIRVPGARVVGARPGCPNNCQVRSRVLRHGARGDATGCAPPPAAPPPAAASASKPLKATASSPPRKPTNPALGKAKPPRRPRGSDGF
jgi:hypothetical protein